MGAEKYCYEETTKDKLIQTWTRSLFNCNELKPKIKAESKAELNE